MAGAPCSHGRSVSRPARPRPLTPALVEIGNEDQHRVLRPGDARGAVPHGAVDVGAAAELHREQHLDGIVEGVGEVDHGGIEHHEAGRDGGKRATPRQGTQSVRIVRPDKGVKGFAVQPRRWVIERTFDWIARCCRLTRDDEATPSSAIALFVLAAVTILVRRVAQTL